MSAPFDPDDFAKTLKVAWASAKEKMKEDTINNIIVAFPVFYKCGAVLQWLNLLHRSAKASCTGKATNAIQCRCDREKWLLMFVFVAAKN